MVIFLKRPVVFIPLIVVLAIVSASYFYFFKPKKPIYEFAAAERTNLVQEVSLTGRVKPAKSANLGFEINGRVARIYAEIGDTIAAGQILIRLENADLFAKLEEARANAKAQKAKLDELKKGVRPEEVQIQEEKIKSAATALLEAEKGFGDKLQDAYTKSDDAVRNKIDQFYNNPKSRNPEFNIVAANSQLKITLEEEKIKIEDILNSWQLSFNAVKSEEVKSNLNQIKFFLEKIALAVNSLTPTATLSKTVIDGYKNDVSTARTNINAAISNLLSAEEKTSAAKSSLAIAKNELALKKAGTIAEQITAQEAQLEGAEANLKNIQSQIAKTILRSPISGIATKIDAKIGEIIAANANIVSIISEKEFEIEADAPEADIAKIKIGKGAKITLDAYGSDIIFEAKVVKIDPAETIIGGVATYKTTLQLTDKDERVKSGMTANINILTDKRENIIAVPQRAVITENGEKTARILQDNGIIKETKIIAGLRGSDGNVEIIEGIKEGDKVIIFEKK